jgi:hypothetical protein
VKLGGENRNKLIAAVSLGIVAVVAVVWQFSGFFAGGSSSADSTPVTTTGPTSAITSTSGARRRGNAATRSSTGKKDVAQNLDPSLRFDVLKSSEDTKYEGAGRNIFRVFVEPPPRPVAPVITPSEPGPAAVYTPPPPPPIELRFYGFATPAGGTKRIFLAHNEDVFIAKEGDIVDRRYKVVRISPTSVDILDVLSNNRQSIPLTQG